MANISLLSIYSRKCANTLDVLDRFALTHIGRRGFVLITADMPLVDIIYDRQRAPHRHPSILNVCGAVVIICVAPRLSPFSCWPKQQAKNQA